MQRKLHAVFLGDGGVAMHRCYPTTHRGLPEIWRVKLFEMHHVAKIATVRAIETISSMKCQFVSPTGS